MHTEYPLCTGIKDTCIYLNIIWGGGEMVDRWGG